jgi:hypothetical protein
MNMPVATGSFRILQGMPRAWRRIRAGGVQTASWFCGDCSGRLYGERDSRPASINVRAWTLDDTSWLVPVAHLFMRNAQSWDNVTGDAGRARFRVLSTVSEQSAH